MGTRYLVTLEVTSTVTASSRAEAEEIARRALDSVCDGSAKPFTEDGGTWEWATVTGDSTVEVA